MDSVDISRVVAGIRRRAAFGGYLGLVIIAVLTITGISTAYIFLAYDSGPQVYIAPPPPPRKGAALHALLGQEAMHWLIIGAIALGAGGIGVAVVWCAWWLWWRLPKRQVDRLSLKIRDPRGRADVEDNFRKTIGQLLGGIAVLIGAALAYLQFSQQQQTAQKQLTQQQQTSHDLLISNQVSKGFEQLGSDKIVVRLGGIYALEGVMNTSQQYHQPVLEALCAFVRDGTKAEPGDGPPNTDIQAALTVIGRRAAGSGRVNLSSVHIPKAILIYANLLAAVLVDANLSGATLVGATLIGASLDGAHLNGADLTGADLTQAHLNGTTLSNADLSGTKKVSQTQLDEACGTEAKLPPGLKLKPC